MAGLGWERRPCARLHAIEKGSREPAAKPPIPFAARRRVPLRSAATGDDDRVGGDVQGVWDSAGGGAFCG